MKRNYFLLLIVSLVMFMASCSKDDDKPAKQDPIIDAISISNTQELLKIGESLTLDLKVIPKTDNLDIIFSSSDKDIATVDAKGVIVGVKEGDVKIKATYKKLSTSISLTVINGNLELPTTLLGNWVGSDFSVTLQGKVYDKEAIKALYKADVREYVEPFYKERTSYTITADKNVVMTLRPYLTLLDKDKIVVNGKISYSKNNNSVYVVDFDFSKFSSDNLPDALKEVLEQQEFTKTDNGFTITYGDGLKTIFRKKNAVEQIQHLVFSKKTQTVKGGTTNPSLSFRIFPTYCTNNSIVLDTDNHDIALAAPNADANAPVLIQALAHGECNVIVKSVADNSITGSYTLTVSDPNFQIPLEMCGELTGDKVELILEDGTVLSEAEIIEKYLSTKTADEQNAIIVQMRSYNKYTIADDNTVTIHLLLNDGKYAPIDGYFTDNEGVVNSYYGNFDLSTANITGLDPRFAKLEFKYIPAEAHVVVETPSGTETLRTYYGIAKQANK